jgi:hypothetical protein
LLAHVLYCANGFADADFRGFYLRLSNALRPTATSSLVLGTATDPLRSKGEPVAENALLR